MQNLWENNILENIVEGIPEQKGNKKHKQLCIHVFRVLLELLRHIKPAHQGSVHACF